MASTMVVMGAQVVLAAVTDEDVSGLIPNNAGWAHYGTQRIQFSTSYGVKLNTWSWSGTDQYYYLRRCNNDNPIGAGSSSSPVKAAVNDTGLKQLGPLTANQCFRMNAKKDFSGFSGSSWWTGQLHY